MICNCSFNVHLFSRLSSPLSNVPEEEIRTNASNDLGRTLTYFPAVFIVCYREITRPKSDSSFFDK